MGDPWPPGRRASWRGLAATLSAGAALAFLSPALILAATPVPTRPGGDTRSAGEGPGLVGEPVLAIGLVVAIAIVTVVLTLAYVRLTAGDSASPTRRP